MGVKSPPSTWIGNMQITPHIHNMHIDDGAVSHPGGSNNYFVGDPNGEMLLLDTGDHWREWTRAILDFYARTRQAQDKRRPDYARSR